MTGPPSSPDPRVCQSLDFLMTPRVDDQELTMCKHILNAQVAIRSPCCRKWFDCAECHKEQENHPLLQSLEMTFACKKCKKCFRKDAQEFEESDEYCPHCDNHFVIDAKTPQAALSVESEDVRMNSKMLKDDRTKQQKPRTIFDPDEDANRLG
ncbi:hypothetical protein GQ602_004911 [Ophiocordyceps camponoti-floridani]|uniref:CHY-type domain-containing protein n=1 Tax=Ophiocordyceps camponoti-floridani TaxID=2030778 RepID=A0A8H4Q4R7_9HYPO|nr:hypothetical protein GQ602_004911 [Ophiocordyceps camponoti-floridani]